MPTINGRACIVNGKPVDKVFSNGRQVYGRNLLIGSGTSQTVAAQTWGDNPHLVLDTSKLKIGDTISTQVKVSGLKDTNVFVGINSKQVSPLFSNGMETFTITWTKELSELPLPIEFSVKPAALTDEFTWSQAKAEIGTTASPWSPAPEDVM